MKPFFYGLVGVSVLIMTADVTFAGPSHAHSVKPRLLRQTASSAASAFGVMLGIDRTSYVSAKTPTTLHATMTLFNNTDTPLTFLEHGQRVTWQILDAQGNVVWDYAQGRMFSHLVMRRSLTQGKLDYAQDIPLTAQDGSALPAGAYTLRGRVIGARSAAEVGFTVTSE